MNKSAIEWCHYTWNPITGCLHGCPYCYARKIATRFKGTKAWPMGFEPTYHPERLEDPKKVKKPSRIFCGSMTDLFGEWVPKFWVHDILSIINQTPQHRYLILTKNPARIRDIIYGSLDYFFGGGDFLDNVWLGTSVTTQDDVHRIETLKKHAWEWHKFVSFEPLLGHIDCDLTGIEWIIIGAQTNPTIEVDPEWLNTIVESANQAGIPVFFKDSLQRYSTLQEYPDGLKVQP